jgi:hypothetical protein
LRRSIARDDTGPFMEPHLHFVKSFGSAIVANCGPTRFAWQVTGAWQPRFGPD